MNYRIDDFKKNEKKRIDAENDSRSCKKEMRYFSIGLKI